MFLYVSCMCSANSVTYLDEFSLSFFFFSTFEVKAAKEAKTSAIKKAKKVSGFLVARNGLASSVP